MMSGDSTEPQAKPDSVLELKELPIAVACSSNGAPGKIAGETVTASVLVEPQPRQQTPTDMTGSPNDDISGLKCSKSTSTDDDTIETASTPLSNKKLDNGVVDTLDGDPTKLINSNNKKQVQEEEEEEGCAVKCLYYTLQCCECTIM